MQTLYSETLSQILKRAQAAPAGARLADQAMLEVLEGIDCHASHIIGKHLHTWEVAHIASCLREHIADAATATPGGSTPSGTLGKDIALRCADLLRPTRSGGMMANTGHLLLYAMREQDSVAARQIAMCNLSEKQVAQYVADLPAEEDYYAEMRALENLQQNLRKHKATQAGFQEENSSADEDDDYSPDEGNYSEGRTIRVKTARKSSSSIDRFGTNLTRAAAAGQIDPVVGREAEIQRLIQILGRRKKNNPILIGEAGVGKSAIVEGLALRIAHGEVPYCLRGKTIFSLDMASLVAGTKYRGQFEERIKAMLDEIIHNKNTILFIDELHTIVGAGSTQGSLDAANILKPALARGQVQCIGATTLNEYRENIEKDAALERRFQKIVVEPATPAQTTDILNNIKAHYERHHMVRYTDEAIRACVELTGRYLADRHFPDKAIDAMDEAGSRAHLDHARPPESIATLERAIGEAAAARYAAITAQNYPAAAEARIREAALRSKLAENHADWLRELEASPLTITATHIEQVVTSMTGVPVEKVSQNEKQRLHRMSDHLTASVIGQPGAVEKVTRSIQRTRAGLKDPGKPIGVFMFVGPTGVGKTHLAKQLSLWMFDRPEALIRIDMSEYSEKHNVSRLIGSPPGYVGYNEGGQLTEAVRRQPYAVVLFDEIEKAHPDVFNVMLQIFDDGWLTDGLGRKVDFRNTIVIMTSNVGSRRIAERGKAVGFPTAGTDAAEELNLQAQYRRSLEQTFAPEFINRIDDIVIFNTLSASDIEHIVEFELETLVRRAQALGYTLTVSGEALGRLAALGYEPRYGVRSLKRTILERVEEPLAQMIVAGRIAPGDAVEIGCRNECIELTRIETAAA